jgi:Cu-Zn family superoxide dismutase
MNRFIVLRLNPFVDFPSFLNMKNRTYPFRPTLALAAVSAAALLAACATPAPKPIEAVAELRATGQPQPDPNAPVTGTLHFRQWQDQVAITGQVEHLPPPDSGRWSMRGHALHIHDGGDCSAPDPASASGTFNPTGKKHSFPGAGMVGDLPTLLQDQQGVATVNYLSPQAKLDGPDSIVGKTVMVHSNRDDWVTQPDGHAGPAIACGVIRVVTPSK